MDRRDKFLILIFKENEKKVGERKYHSYDSSPCPSLLDTFIYSKKNKIAIQNHENNLPPMVATLIIQPIFIVFFFFF